MDRGERSMQPSFVSGSLSLGLSVPGTPFARKLLIRFFQIEDGQLGAVPQFQFIQDGAEIVPHCPL